MNEPATCRSCSAPIRWEKTENGRNMPLDAEPSPAGNIYLRKGLALCVSAKNVPPPDAPLYLSHFARCPQAKKHRRGRQ